MKLDYFDRQIQHLTKIWFEHSNIFRIFAQKHDVEHMRVHNFFSIQQFCDHILSQLFETLFRDRHKVF